MMRNGHNSILIGKITLRFTLTGLPGLHVLLLAGRDFLLHPQIKFGHVDNDAIMYTLAYQITLVTRTYPEFDDATADVDDFRPRGHLHAHRCRGDMSNVEVCAKALMPFWQ